MPHFGQSEEILLAKPEFLQEKRSAPGTQPNFYVWPKGENRRIVFAPHAFVSFWRMFDNYSATNLKLRHYINTLINCNTIVLFSTIFDIKNAGYLTSKHLMLFDVCV